MIYNLGFAYRGYKVCYVLANKNIYGDINCTFLFEHRSNFQLQDEFQSIFYQNMHSLRNDIHHII
jgi:hypothetical protein